MEAMATGIRKGTLSGVRKLSNLGRGSVRWVETSQSSSDDNSEELTPLTDPRAEIDFRTILGPTEGTKKKGVQKSRKEPQDTAEVLNSNRQAAEERIKLFAFRMAYIEKAVSLIGKSVFVWATVVLLGGFATSLTFTNFWLVALIIFVGGLRILNRSHELEWRVFSSKTVSSISSDPGGPAPYRSNHDVESPSTISTIGGDYSPSSSSITSNRTSRSGGKQGVGVQHQPEPQSNPVHNSEVQAKRILFRRNIISDSASSPFLSNLLKPRRMSRTRIILYYLEIFSASFCISAAITSLVKQDFCVPDEGSTQTAGNQTDGTQTNGTQKWVAEYTVCQAYRENIVFSVDIFYCIAVLEGTLFLVKNYYFEYRISLLGKVKEELFEGKLDNAVFEHFFFTVFNMCLKGSVYDGLDMNLVAFGIQWLESNDFEQQLHGAKLLNGFVSAKSKDNSKQGSQTADALRRLGTSPGIIERLVDMLFWNAEHEEELVGEVAAIVYGLVAYDDRNRSKFVALPGALDAVVSLLMPHAGNFSVDGKDSSKAFTKVLDLQVKALKILKYLCKSYTNSLEIGKTRGLLPILVLFIQAQGRSANGNAEDHEARLSVFKKSLEVLYYLVANKGTSGRALRQHVAGVVSVLKNLRDVIKDCDEEPYLQLLSIKILYDLALEENVRCSIGATGGIIRLLFNHFRQNYAQTENSEKDRELKQDRMKWSGKVLSRLMLQNKDNCLTFLRLKDKDGKKHLVDVMIASLRGGEGVSVSAAEILRSVLKYADESTRMEIAERSAPIVLANISHSLADTKSGLYEASLGLASRATESLPLVNYRTTMESLSLVKNRETPSSVQFMDQMVKNLKHSPTTSKVPKIRRYSLEVIIAVVERDEYFKYFLGAFAGLNLEDELETTLESISEVENFILLSGLLGYSRHSEDIKSLVSRCIAAVDHRFSSESTLPRNGKVAAP